MGEVAIDDNTGAMEIALLLISTSGLLPSVHRPSLLPATARLPAVTHARMQFAQPPDTSDETIYPRGPDGEVLM